MYLFSKLNGIQTEIDTYLQKILFTFSIISKMIYFLSICIFFLALYVNFKCMLKKPTFADIFLKVKLIVLPIAIILRLNPIEIPKSIKLKPHFCVLPAKKSTGHLFALQEKTHKFRTNYSYNYS